jgi:hypothetical protein
VNLNAQSICLWLAAVFGVVLAGAFVVFPGFFPPASPGASAHEVAAFYAHNKTMIRASMITFDFCGVMLMPLFMVIVHQMKRMATSTDVFAYGYMSAALSGVTLVALADLFWLIAAFRPDRDPQLLVLLNDFAWITFTAPVGTFVAQNLCLALAVYMDKRPVPVFPRWVGHFNLVTAACIAPAACASVFKSGPLAWNGAISFWLRLGTFSVYMATMFFVLRIAVRREAAEPTEDSSGVPVLVPA